MAEPIINGNPGPIFQPFNYDYDPKFGYNIRQPVRGTVNYIRGQSAQLAGFRIAHSVRDLGGGMAEIVSKDQTVPGDPNNETPIDGWQLLGNVVQKDIYQHPSLLSADEDDIIDLKKAVETRNGLDAPSGTIFQKFFMLLLRGVTHFETVNYVLRHTQTVSNQYTKDILDEHVFKIYKRETLFAECAKFNVPLYGRYVNKIKAIPDPEEQEDYFWGWYKQPSTEVGTANNKIEITNDWILEQWSTVLYGQPI
jgi:hypothetical protein